MGPLRGPWASEGYLSNAQGLTRGSLGAHGEVTDGGSLAGPGYRGALTRLTLGRPRRMRAGEGGAGEPCGPRRPRGVRGWRGPPDRGPPPSPGSVLLPPSSSPGASPSADSVGGSEWSAESERKGIQSISAAIGTLISPRVRISTHIHVVIHLMLLRGGAGLRASAHGALEARADALKKMSPTLTVWFSPLEIRAVQGNEGLRVYLNTRIFPKWSPGPSGPAILRTSSLGLGSGGFSATGATLKLAPLRGLHLHHRRSGVTMIYVPASAG